MSRLATVAGAVWPLEDCWAAEAGQLARRLGWPLAPPETAGLDVCLLVDAGTRLVDCRHRHGASLRVWPERLCDLPVPPRYRQVKLAGESLLKAIGARHGLRPSVVDATAGLASDAVLMALAGCPVRMIERSALLGVMLERGLARLRSLGPLGNGRLPQLDLPLHCGDASELLRVLAPADVVYLDPMYRMLKRKSAPSGEMQLLDRLMEGAVEDSATEAARLFAAAMACARDRVVVKRSLRAPALVAEPSVHHRIEGRSTRFDVYQL